VSKHGGHREGTGRKPKADEKKMIERLKQLEDKAFNTLNKALDKNESWAVKLYFEYRYGKPRQTIEQTNTNYDIVWNEEKTYG